MPSRRDRDTRDECFRWARDDHRRSLRSGCRQVTWVVNGPTNVRAITLHPGGVAGYCDTAQRAPYVSAGTRGLNCLSSSCPAWMTP